MSDQEIRLSKRLVELGLCASRREADEAIEQGLVLVDGLPVTTLGSRVTHLQQIVLNPRVCGASDAPGVLLLHKPANVILDPRALIRQQTRSPEAPDTGAWRALLQNPACTGAVDAFAEGLVALTRDKRLAGKLAECETEFLIGVDRAPPAAELANRFAQIAREEHPAPGVKATRQSDRQVRLTAHGVREGQLLRWCEQAGLAPRSVRCIRIGRIAIGRLAPGQWRGLLANERF
ncbi:S4 domain-containing protein [Paludibacterium paludis]|uniref:Dual-specificity RNA pseudouridine synthase RluF n=1 Tax=Paludibacterium paludis TaxID=1225769 RepID=A0A918UAS2_9NEIS|nr:S4 domain-containing protein [Paludibacterium paludis]GGY18402.1 RNA-binding protein S4 [Paludibacterium paludis]